MPQLSKSNITELNEIRDLVELTATQTIKATLSAPIVLTSGASAVLATDSATSSGGDAISHAAGIYTNTGAEPVPVVFDIAAQFTGAADNGTRRHALELETAPDVWTEQEAAQIDAGDDPTSPPAISHALTLAAGQRARVSVLAVETDLTEDASVATSTLVEVRASVPAQLTEYIKTTEAQALIQHHKNSFTDLTTLKAYEGAEIGDRVQVYIDGQIEQAEAIAAGRADELQIYAGVGLDWLIVRRIETIYPDDSKLARGIIVPRHASFGERIRNAVSDGIPAGAVVGNSIAQGTGGGGAEGTMPRHLARALQSFTGHSDVNSWSATNYGVGGCTTPAVLGYVSDTFEGAEIVNGSIASGLDYLIILTLRNDASGSVQVKSTAEMLKQIFAQCVNKGIEPFLVIDPPRIDMTTGEIEDGETNTFLEHRKAALSAAAHMGASVVDVWAELKSRLESGEDIRAYSADGVHPNSAGYLLMAELIAQAMLAPSVKAPAAQYSTQYPDNVSNYEAAAGTQNLVAVAGLQTLTTSRKRQTGEASVMAYELLDGEVIEFDASGPAQAIVIHLLGGVSGSVSLTYADIVLTGGYGADVSNTRENSHIIAIPTFNSAYKKTGRIKLTASGTVRVLGVSVLGERVLGTSPTYAQKNLAGTWDAATLPDGAGAAIESNVVGDELEIRFYGSRIFYQYKKSTSGGKFEVYRDGVLVLTTNAYLNAAARTVTGGTDAGVDGWHTLRIVNVSDGPTEVMIGQFKRTSQQAVPLCDFVPVDTAQTITSRVNYKGARTNAGSAVAYKSAAFEYVVDADDSIIEIG